VQNGYSTPGLIMSLTEFLAKNPNPDEKAIRLWLDGVLSRETGYQSIVTAVLSLADKPQ